MKKDSAIFVRVESNIRHILEQEAQKLDRSVSWIVLTRLKQSLRADGLLVADGQAPERKPL